jgi:hypothetical protein
MACKYPHKGGFLMENTMEQKSYSINERLFKIHDERDPANVLDLHPKMIFEQEHYEHLKRVMDTLERDEYDSIKVEIVPSRSESGNHANIIFQIAKLHNQDNEFSKVTLTTERKNPFAPRRLLRAIHAIGGEFEFYNPEELPLHAEVFVSTQQAYAAD